MALAVLQRKHRLVELTFTSTYESKAFTNENKGFTPGASSFAIFTTFETRLSIRDTVVRLVKFLNKILN